MTEQHTFELFEASAPSGISSRNFTLFTPDRSGFYRVDAFVCPSGAGIGLDISYTDEFGTSITNAFSLGTSSSGLPLTASGVLHFAAGNPVFASFVLSGTGPYRVMARATRLDD